MDEIEQVPGPARKRTRAGIVAGVLVAGALFAAFALNNTVAIAQTPTPTTPAAPALGMKFAHGPGPGFGFGGIHGESVVPAANGGYQTIAHQIGKVTSVSASSVTVKSEDGFSRTYSIDDNSLVNAGNNGIADVKNGDTVRVTAVVTDGKAHAVELVDETNVGAISQQWRPGPPAIVVPAPSTP